MADYTLAGDACNNAIGALKTNLMSGEQTLELTAENIIGSLLLECVLTFIFCYVILNVTDKKNNTGLIAGLIIGLTLTLVHLVGIGLTGTSVNPARSIATALAQAIYNGKAFALQQIWIFIVGPMAGGALAALVFKLLHKTEETDTEVVQ